MDVDKDEVAPLLMSVFVLVLTLLLLLILVLTLLLFVITVYFKQSLLAINIYPWIHSLHIKSVVNIWQFIGTRDPSPNKCKKYIKPELLISNVIVYDGWGWFIDVVVVDVVEVGVLLILLLSVDIDVVVGIIFGGI